MITEDQQRTFVLVPGAWHGAWAWDGIVARLRRAGHRTVAVTLDGLEPDPSPDGARANLDTHIDRVLAALESCSPGPITLCGHSYAGLVIAGAADRSERAVDRLVFCDAFVPADGDSWWDLANDHYRDRIIAGVGTDGRTVAPSADTDPRRRPHPVASFLQRLRLGDGIDRVARRTLIHASAWEATPFQNQYERLRTDPAWEVHDLPVGHAVYNEAPDDLTSILTGGRQRSAGSAVEEAFEEGEESHAGPAGHGVDDGGGDAGQYGEEDRGAECPRIQVLGAAGEAYGALARREHLDDAEAPPAAGPPGEPVELHHPGRAGDDDHPQIRLADPGEGGPHRRRSGRR
jgi:pimeloyl-ACP methyl ester carboxylesterase